MLLKLVCASHSPLLGFPGRETEDVVALRAAITATRERVQAFDPELIIQFGCDHYGGHQMASMPAFCVGVAAEALADVGGTPGALSVPKDVAVAAVEALRTAEVDVAVSYAMEVDHGFSQALQEFTGALAAYPVLPIFVSALQPPFVPFKRARALGEAMASFIRELPFNRVLILATGGLSHDPEALFPSIENVSEQWRPYHLHGKRQSAVSQQSWIEFEIHMHGAVAAMIGSGELAHEHLKINEAWDRKFVELLGHGDLAAVDSWTPSEVIAEAGFGSMEVLVWIAGTTAMDCASGVRPTVTFLKGLPDLGIGFGIVETGPAPLAVRPRVGAL